MAASVGLKSSMLNDITIQMVVTGYPTGAHLISFINSTFPTATFRHVFWDFSDASLAMMEVSEFESTEAAARQYSEARGPDLKTAVLLANSADVLLIRAYSAMTLKLKPMAMKASTDRRELLDWLGV
ncbi:hypothetical protein [Thalassobaculum litoreum]|uniref:Uncharacterized protein n=1 Tax=Thalassobaculum litoreum DSM 18839 TaxID=1123362 RepID=A0A8G2BEV9_9PROT|nr:hypothetical protein [Thalassobaculum litoreum]SDF15906.1 hypothetical protein SAMN05660686_00503 [Thalassobaculum litoreum DSM 18839]